MWNSIFKEFKMNDTMGNYNIQSGTFYLISSIAITTMHYTVMHYTVMSAWIRTRDIIHHSRCILVCRFRIYTQTVSPINIK
jgi:hypothetical protein